MTLERVRIVAMWAALALFMAAALWHRFHDTRTVCTIDDLAAPSPACAAEGRP